MTPALKKNLFCMILVFTLLTACAPASTPVPEISVSNANAIAAVDRFYASINDAATKDDLSETWGYLSNEAQCNPVNRCELSAFQERRWKSKVIYSLYDCGPNRVVAQELSYPRDAEPASANGSPKYWLYVLSEVEDGLLISEIDLISAPGAECKPVGS